jgi:hypothetical protein
MAMSDYLENAIINHVLRNTALSSPTSVYISLYTSNPTDENTGTEVTGGSYQRVPVTAGFTAPASGEVFNSASIVFNTATGSWGNVRYVGITNALTSGSLLFYEELSASRTVLTGDSFKIKESNMGVRIGASYSPIENTANPLGFSTYLSNKLLDHILNNSAYSTPGTNVYAALYLTVPTKADSGGVEVSGSVGYSRMQVSGTSGWSAPSNGFTANSSTITFIDSCVTGWDTLRGVGLRDAASSGNLLFVGTFNTPKTVIEGDGFKFNASALQVILS